MEEIKKEIETYEKLKNKEISNNELKDIQKSESKDNLKNNSNNEENKYIKINFLIFLKYFFY